MSQLDSRRQRWGSAALAFALLVLVASLAVRAQQPAQTQAPAQPATARPGGPPQGGAPPTPPRPIVPATASSIASKPEAYYGQLVSIYAAVEEQLAPTAFSVDQDKTKRTGKEVVVLAPRLHEAVQPNAYVTVIGEVVKPDAAEIAKKVRPGTPTLPADVLAKHATTPVILANSVVNSAFADLAKFIPPPMTPEEEVLDKAMKAVGGANGALRKGIDAANAELVKTNTAVLHKAFTETEAFWKKRGNADAVKFAQTALKAVGAIETAAGMGNWNEAKAQNTTLGQQCQSCHVFRERGEDGSFYIKPVSK
jgi:hypothetical protein